MKFHIVDTEAAYRRLLDAPDATTREAIFRDELVEPFSGLVKFFGGGDGVAAFKNWSMSPDQFGPDNREFMRDLIDTLAAHDAWRQAAEALDEGRAAFAQYADRIPLETVIFGLYLADMRAAPWSEGYTGFGGIPGWIMTVYGSATEYNLARVKSATVHELHHNIMGAVGAANGQPGILISSLGAYMVGEGLAESLAAELYGADKTGPWVTNFDASRLEDTRQKFKAALHITDFNQMRGYIFGDSVAEASGLPQTGVPPLAGYALGYRVVQAYLKRTGQSVVDATFVSPLEIIEVSEFFA